MLNFKPARCPSCGGSLQVPENLNTVKCMYCGGEVVVRDAIQLAGRVKEFMNAIAIEKVVKDTPFPIEREKNQLYLLLSIVGGVVLLMALCNGGELGIFLGIGFLVVLPLILLNHFSKIKKLKQANEVMSKKPPTVVLMRYEGQCPYCDSAITLPPNTPGADCPACNKRIVIRDSKFLSVDTPVGRHPLT